MMRPSGNLAGVLLMVAAMAAFTGNDTLMKAATREVPLFQAIFLRGVVTLLLLAGLSRVTGDIRLGLPRRDRGVMALRLAGEVLATALFLTALQYMALANLSAIMQSLPLVMTLLAAVVFGEGIGWRRLLAVLAGFVGVLLIIKPGAEGFNVWSLMGLAAMLAVALRDLSTRRLSADLPSMTVVAYAAIAVMLLGAVASPFQGWAPVPPVAAVQLAGSGAFLIAGYLCITMAMRTGEMAVVAPFRYTALLWAILLGWISFGQLPDRLTLAGAGIVIVSGLFTLWRESRLAGKRGASQA
ncbi:DMT family transporter [Frigidibacter oleivorans]|uniref:DMT family transporter n=1 Tax=Frigidibacter oleivorans TaxID=2487129 RepID=UPI001F22F601|nr:DMT family transporter [Frigidibacter oleivorans]